MVSSKQILITFTILSVSIWFTPVTSDLREKQEACIETITNYTHYKNNDKDYDLCNYKEDQTLSTTYTSAIKKLVKQNNVKQKQMNNEILKKLRQLDDEYDDDYLERIKYSEKLDNEQLSTWNLMMEIEEDKNEYKKLETLEKLMEKSGIDKKVYNDINNKTDIIIGLREQYTAELQKNINDTKFDKPVNEFCTSKIVEDNNNFISQVVSNAIKKSP